MMMSQNKRILISNLYKKLGIEDEDLTQLVDAIAEDDSKIDIFKESVIDTLSDYHEDKRLLKEVVEELVVVLSATREYELNRNSYSPKQEQLLWDTGSEVLIKALKALNKN
jgi:hypothetical protein